MPPHDLALLVAGKDERETIEGLLQRPQRLGIRPVSVKSLVHPRRDPGCYKEAEHILQPLQGSASHALVVFDHEGSGQESKSGSDLESRRTQERCEIQ